MNWSYSIIPKNIVFSLLVGQRAQEAYFLNNIISGYIRVTLNKHRSEFTTNLIENNENVQHATNMVYDQNHH